jgi:hypothetical protein
VSAEVPLDDGGGLWNDGVELVIDGVGSGVEDSTEWMDESCGELM